MRRILVALVATSLVLLVPGAAEAAPTSRTDPQGDVESRLDMRAAKLAKQGNKVVITVRTWTPFSDADLARPGGIGVDFKVSSKALRSPAIRSTGSRVYGEICSYKAPRYAKATKCSRVKVARVSSTSYRMVVPLAKIRKGARTLAWRASSLALTGVAGCGNLCVDGVGNKGAKYYRWRL